MSHYPNVTKEDMINLAELAEQQKNQKAIKYKNRFLKHTHNKKLAENFEPVTEITYESEWYTKKLEKVFKKPDCEIGNKQKLVSVQVDTDYSEAENDNVWHLPIISLPSEVMRETLCG